MRGRQKVCLPPTLIFFLSCSFLGTLPSLGQHPTLETGPSPQSLPLLSLSPSLHLIIFHPDAMLLMNSIKSSFVIGWKTHSESGSILCADTLQKQSLGALCVFGCPEETFVTNQKGRDLMGAQK